MIMNDFSFAWPLSFVFGSVVLLVTLVRKNRAVTVAHMSNHLQTQVSFFERIVLSLAPFFSLCALFALTIAAARPQQVRYLGTENMRRNIILCIDVSRSMQEQDFGTGIITKSRLLGVQEIAAEFINARSNDRIGLVIFGEEAFVQTPLTYDRAVVLQMLQLLRPGMVGDGTALGDGLAISLQRVQDIDPTTAAVILLSDGVSNSGRFSPVVAAEVAKELNVRVHTIAIGGQKRGLFGSADADAKTLQQISQLTGGSFFTASNISNLREVYNEIDTLETSRMLDEPLVETREYFSYPGVAALIMFLLSFVLNHFLVPRLP